MAKKFMGGKLQNPQKLDFASDQKPEKHIAREMMKMTAKINKKFFHWKDENGMLTQISCITCHNGKEHPNTYKIGNL